MRRHAMHCLVCDRKLSWYRRIFGYWYCSDRHFAEDRERREDETDLVQGKLNPMLCEHCGRPVGLFRRILAREFCSEICFTERFATKPRPAPNTIEVEIEGKKQSIRVPMTRFGFLLALFVMSRAIWSGGTGVDQTWDFVQEVRRRFLPDKRAHFTEWAGNNVKDWIAVGSTTLELQGAWMHPLGTVLYEGVKEAAHGAIDFHVSLADFGSAGFLLGSDALGRNCFLLQLASGATDLTLSAFQIRDERAFAIPGSLTVRRGNNALHNVHIDFRRDSMAASINGVAQTWHDLRIEPGLIGVRGGNTDDFRIYSAVLDLQA
jgi:hypothetical protein